LKTFAPHATDFYKPAHRPMYPAGTEVVYSNLTNRSDTHAKVLGDFDHKTVWFGLQGFIKTILIDLWNDTFFSQPKNEVIAKIKRRFDSSLGEGAIPVDCFADLHDLGYLPLKIKSLPEGSRVDIKIPLLTVTNTDPRFFWLTNYIESQLSAELWKMGTSATTAYEYRRLFEKYAAETGVDKTFVEFQGHDFSMRGMSGIADATTSGAGHLLSFKGTDTITAIDYLEDYYGAEGFVGGSVPASEHSVMCMGGQEDEVATFRRLINEVYPNGIVSIVSDSWDFWKVMTEFTVTLKDEIMSREGKVVFRPDSGDPVKIIVGEELVPDYSHIKDFESAKEWAADNIVDRVRNDTPHGEGGSDYERHNFTYKGQVYDIAVDIDWNRYDKQYYFIDGYIVRECVFGNLTPAQKGAVECLWDVFGGNINEQGYKTLDSHVGLIYGDSISLERAQAILSGLKAKGFSSANIVFGIGSFTYQFVTRDTFGSAVKATYGVVNGKGRELFKDPKTDSGMKKSARGLLRVEREGDKFVLYDQQSAEQESRGMLQTVFLDGVLTKEQTMQEIRERLWPTA
jgi:nicotinamide phosphoribosyltransferase